MKALILMTRVPIPGKTKTRLMEILSGEMCAELHKAFLRDLFNIFDSIKEEIDIFVTYTPEGSLHIIKDMIPHYVQCFSQEGEKLGERMQNAIKHVLDRGYTSVVLIGSDIPDIKPMDLLNAFEILNSNDVCIGPTLDGGYYLIGMKKMYKEIFTDELKWGNKTVLEGTLDIANKLGLKVGLVEKYRDIDTKLDLIAFKNRIDQGEFSGKYFPVNTIELINKYWSGGGNVKGKIKG